MDGRGHQAVGTVVRTHDGLVNELQVDEQTRARLGEAVLADLMANLWPRDCLTCGQPFGRGGGRDRSATMALVVNESEQGPAMAGLHHRRCRRPEWVRGSHQPAPLTWQATGFLRDQDDMPTIVINPSYEAALLLSEQQRWWVANLDLYTAVGFSLDPLPPEAAPVPGLEVALNPDRYVVSLDRLPVGPWWTHTDEEFRHAATRAQRVRVGITTFVDVTLGTVPISFDGLVRHRKLALGLATLTPGHTV